MVMPRQGSYHLLVLSSHIPLAPAKVISIRMRNIFDLSALRNYVLIRPQRNPRTPMELLGVLAAILVILTPILAITAFVRVQHLTDQLRALLPRLDVLERHLRALENSPRSYE